jgi:transposase
MKLSELWLPEDSAVRVTDVVVENRQLIMIVSSLTTRAVCPYCGFESTRVNNQYYRRPADLPFADYAVQLQMKVRCFFCENANCEHYSFAERFPAIVKPYARRTDRLSGQQEQVAFEVSAEAGARILEILTMCVSPDTLIRQVRDAPELEPETPRVLGVDDWAKRKGQTYGTILVDLETRCPVDVLSDRSAESLREWLAEHPGVEIITRDRSGEFAAGATDGAPAATQIADRFHLLQNLTDALKRMFDRQPKELQAAAQLAAELTASPEGKTPEEPVPVHIVEAGSADPVTQTDQDRQVETPNDSNPKAPTRAQMRFAEVKTLQDQGLSQRAVADQLHMSRGSVRRYWQLGDYPKRQPGPSSVSSVTPYLPYLLQRWQEGEQNRMTLWHELQEQGYAGSYASVWRATSRLASDGIILIGGILPTLSTPALSPRRAAWLFSTVSGELKPEQQHLRDAIQKVCLGAEEVYVLAQDFGQMIRNRQVDAFDSWLLSSQYLRQNS